MFSAAIIGRKFGALCATFFGAVAVSCGTIPKFQIVLLGFTAIIVVNHHSCIVSYPGVLGIISLDIVLN
ncbi:hypothetical protein D3C72_2181190 [compost metagenome]